MRAFRELTVWKKAHALTIGVFRATQRVKRGEFSGLVPQLRSSGSLDSHEHRRGVRTFRPA
jgi:hypothetical protein